MPVPDYQTLMRPVLVAAERGEIRMSSGQLYGGMTNLN